MVEFVTCEKCQQPVAVSDTSDCLYCDAKLCSECWSPGWQSKCGDASCPACDTGKFTPYLHLR